MTYRLREDSMPMDSITFAIDASGENFGFDGQGDEAMDALSDFGATENPDNGTWTMVLDDFKDWCETYGLDPTSKEFVITDENGEEIEDVNSLIYDTGDDIKDAGIAESPDDMPDGFFDDIDDEEEVDIEDPAYWDDAEEIDPSDYDFKNRDKAVENWGKVFNDNRDEEAMAEDEYEEVKNFGDAVHRSFCNDTFLDPAHSTEFQRIMSLEDMPRDRESKKEIRTNKRLKEDTSAFIASPKAAEEKEIPDWVMKAFKESAKETKMLKEWIEKPGESIWDKWDRLALYSKKIFSLAKEVRDAGGNEYAEQLEEVARKMR